MLGINIATIPDETSDVVNLAFQPPVPERPTRSTIRPFREQLKEYLPGVPKDKFGLPIAGTQFNPLPEAKIPKKKESKDKKDKKITPPKSILPSILPDTEPVIHSKLDYSIFSDISYADRSKRQELLSKKTNIFQYDDVNSTDELSVFTTRGQNRQAVIAIRGTTTRGDVGTDSAILFGNPENTRRYHKNSIEIENIKTKLNIPQDRIVLTGHSLGASVAMSESARFGYKAVVFNPGISPLSLLRDPNRNKYKNAPITNYVSPADVISYTSQLGLMPNTYVIPTKGLGLNQHSIKNFTNQIGDYSVDRFDLFEPGSNTENTGTLLKDWDKIPIHAQPEHKKFSGKIGDQLPTPPTLWEIISGKKPNKVISNIDNATKTVANLVKPFIDPDEGFMAIRPTPTPSLPDISLGNIIGDDSEPQLELEGGDTASTIIEEGLEDVIGLGEWATEFGFMP